MEMVRVQCSLWELPHLDLLFRMQWAMAAGLPVYPRTCSTVPLAACRSRVPRTVLSWGKACSWRNACSLGYSEGYEPAGTFSLFFCFLNYQRKVLISIPPVPKEGGREGGRQDKPSWTLILLSTQSQGRCTGMISARLPQDGEQERQTVTGAEVKVLVCYVHNSLSYRRVQCWVQWAPVLGPVSPVLTSAFPGFGFRESMGSLLSSSCWLSRRWRSEVAANWMFLFLTNCLDWDSLGISLLL